ncbi:unnamed protein product [Cylicocyclus nassatus]|uniref:SCP domain-containing protein n=1 Tax=Cylicocyclus nassatus TaxID=53992 RepID=A0AA36M9F8_CYLNA|nr:unnamed protein product [Cylicocyclus nassatus]
MLPISFAQDSNICQTHTKADGYNIDDSARNLILDIHNQKRQATAKAQYRNGRNNFNIRHAKNMMEMEYSCQMEEDAHLIASKCNRQETPRTSLVNGENFYKIDKSFELIGSPTNVAYTAGTAWFEEITKNGINRNLDFTKFLANKKPALYHWTQMVWAETYKIGCDIGDCGDYTILVCRYSPKGNVISKKVYQPGKKLACTLGESQSYATLCNHPQEEEQL